MFELLVNQESAFPWCIGYSGSRLQSFGSEVVYAWQKKKRAKEERDLQQMEGPSQGKSWSSKQNLKKIN